MRQRDTKQRGGADTKHKKEGLEMKVMRNKGIRSNVQIEPKVSIAKEAMEALQHLRQIQSFVPPSAIRQVQKKIKSRKKLDRKLNWQSMMFMIMEDPSFSALAKAFSIFILVMILLSCIAFIVESLPRYSYPHYGEKPGDHPPAFHIIELVCLAVFAVEYVLRLLTVASVPEITLKQLGYHVPVVNLSCIGQGESKLKRIAWIKSPMNIIDLLSIAPILFLIIDEDEGPGLQVLRVLRLTRAFRVFKLGKYSEGLMLFSKVIMKSASALYLLLFFLLISTIVFGSTIYYAERGDWDEEKGYYVRPDLYGDGLERSPFTSIPRSFWWVIVTSTTVGYGDMVPRTTIGRVVGTVAMYFGILVLAMPLAIISSNFQLVHEEYMKHRGGYRNTSSSMSSRMLELIISLEQINCELQKVFAETKVLCGRYLNVSYTNALGETRLDSIAEARSAEGPTTMFDESRLILDEFKALQEQLESLLKYKRTIVTRIKRLAEILVIERKKKKKLKVLL
eukprot:CAMPEP_0184483106 /NCGR_PEP_ID=MMETSP0113_2-20130426/4720_1 /TAXON_ID=91329 /ORGANISM="Norrisiella sphaerica, Strain BC52" /LENGTH=506 /DNA_ID=CAMNT_0026863287 /DNA_START=174 /DNA_END=1694 /DNA_ORIENTATION=+